MAAFDPEAFSSDAFSLDAFDLDAGEPIGPTPDVAVTNRRKVGAFVKRGGVGRLRMGR